MRRDVSQIRFILFPSVFATWLLAGCASLVGPRDVTIPIEKLQASLAARFPFQQRYLDVLDITACRQ